MGQLEKLLDGTQGATLVNKGNYQGSTPDKVAGALQINDLHSTGQPGSEHVHRNIGLKPNDAVYFENPDALGPEALTLRGSTHNSGNTYLDNKPA